jgi:hypothetical protein
MVTLFLLALTIRPHAVTPGLTRPLTQAQVCKTAWGKDRRHVTEAMKRTCSRPTASPSLTARTTKSIT